MSRIAFASVVVVVVLGCAPSPELDLAEGELPPIEVSRLDRSGEGGPCGYPGPGDEGYGTRVGARLGDSADFTLIDCEGTSRTLADFMCERTPGAADFNRGVLVNLGAGWCGPCQEETLELPALYEDFHPRGIEFVQIMFQDWEAQAPTRRFCEDWAEGNWDGEVDPPADFGIGYPLLLDQIFDWTSIHLQDPQSATPVNLLIDANANIRWKSEGTKVPEATLRTQFSLVLDDPYGQGE